MERSFDRLSDLGYPDFDVGLIFISKRLIFAFFAIYTCGIGNGLAF